MGIIVVAYLILHIPAFVLLSIGLGIRKKKEKTSNILLVLAATYFIVGAGCCGAILS